jgi:aminoglycoside/choline kinase family phosphotransferase
MIKNDHPYFIDFQGMRFGLPQYDVASLLFDPYVLFSDEERQVLFEYYCESAGTAWIGDRKHFKMIYKFLTIQRLMQALGAYGFLGIRKGKKHFLKYVEPALLRLYEVVENIEDLSGLKALVNDALTDYKERFKAVQSRI